MALALGPVTRAPTAAVAATRVAAAGAGVAVLAATPLYRVRGGVYDIGGGPSRGGSQCCTIAGMPPADLAAAEGLATVQHPPVWFGGVVV